MSPIAQLIRSDPRSADARLPRPAGLGLTDPERDASARAMGNMLRRGCGVSDILERLAQPNDSAAERLARTLHLQAQLIEIGPRPRSQGGAGKSQRTMERTLAFLTSVTNRLRTSRDQSPPPAQRP